VACVVVEPCCIQETAGVLSLARRTEGCDCKVWDAARAPPTRAAASSRLLLVMVPLGLSEETRADWIATGKGERHTAAMVGVMKNPPIPCLEASTAPMVSGRRGTTVNRGTGCREAVVASCFHVHNVAWMSGVRRMRAPLAVDKACWSKENMCFAP
jgi:hypothetical protein